MHVDRREFRRLVALLALASCDRSGPAWDRTPAVAVPPENAPADAAASPMVTVTPPEPARTSAPESASSAPDEPEPPLDPSCSNEKGTLAACKRIGPACEGLAAECRGLTDHAFRPRVAEAVAQCFASAKRPTCRDKSLGACMRKAVESACIERGTITRCRAIMKACRAARREPSYTLQQCAKVLSAAAPDPGPSGWDQVDEERLGPGLPTGEGCSLNFVLPYQPWGPSWN
jgi:hypothetical protein